ncbi:MAG: ROK family protein [Candidatus Melainabacteria bacterium]|nr:MAG: ROK family protein [Candidatus Melainabacteria bacterium]
MNYIGVDIGGTKIAAGIVTAHGEVIARHERPTPVTEGGPTILRAAIEAVRTVLNSAGVPVSAVGVGAGGQIDPTHGIVFSATDVIPGWKGIKVTEAFSAELALPSFVDNDVNVLALAESRFGAASSFSNGTVVFLALGTGVGGALLIDGKLHHGAHFSGGEFGHILLSMDPNARIDTGGAKGTLEAYCSGPGLVQTFIELSGDTGDVTGHDVVSDACKNPAGFGAQAVQKTGEYLGYGLVSLANALDPDLIVVGGGLAEIGEALLQPAIKVLRETALPGPAKCNVVFAQLGKDSAVIGAASLGMNERKSIASELCGANMGCI